MGFLVTERRAERVAVAKPGRIGSDSVEDSYSVETWLKTGQLRGHRVDWKGLEGGWGGGLCSESEQSERAKLGEEAPIIPCSHTE